MGYESRVSGSANGQHIVQQLLDEGFQQDGPGLDSPTGWFTGTVVVDSDTIVGSAEWQTCYGFEELIAALQQSTGLATVELTCIGEDHDDAEAHLYRNGCWYTMLSVRYLVRADQMSEAERAIESAVAPFGPPNAVAAGD